MNTFVGSLCLVLMAKSQTHSFPSISSFFSSSPESPEPSAPFGKLVFTDETALPPLRSEFVVYSHAAVNSLKKFHHERITVKLD